VDDLLAECRDAINRGGRVLVTTLTKRMAEDLTEYMTEAGIKVRYLHSDVDTLERIEIIRDLRKGVFDVLVGINLLREGLDIPECVLVAILDADKEGLPPLLHLSGADHRPRRAQRRGARAALRRPHDGQPAPRHRGNGPRRTRQQNWNTEHGITPQTIKRQIADVLQTVYEHDYVTVEAVEGDSTSQFVGKDLRSSIAELEKRMRAAAADLEFEEAARLRDEVKRLEAMDLGLAPNLAGRSLQDAAPRQAAPKQDWKPKPLGPGGGGYDPEKKKRGGGRRAR
jgi:excinuclease ABC subunit B